MRCPECGGLDDKVIDSRTVEDGDVIRRRRQCLGCSSRFSTLERLEHGVVVVKRDGRKVPFERAKVESGVLAACKGRPVDRDAIKSLARLVEESVPATKGEITADRIGELVLAQLRVLDSVAAVRFASVYKAFEGPEDFEREVQLLGEEGLH